MSRFRLFLVWLLMAVVPLQGWAAATMLLCGGPLHSVGAHAGASAANQVTNERVAQAPNDHAADGHGSHETGAHQAHHADAGSADGAQTSDGNSHTCGVCASCCHSVALAEVIRWTSFSAAPRVDLAEPLVLILARPSTVPERPPRA